MENNRIKVMIVEDEPDVADVFKLKFENSGFEVQVCGDGFKALVKIQEYRPDVILLDIMMPDMDGLKTLEVIKNQTSLKSKIYIFTNLNNEKDMQRAMSLGADGYFVKANYTPAQVVDIVKKDLGI